MPKFGLYGSYAKEQIDDLYNRLDDDNDDNYDEEYANAWENIIEAGFDYDEPY